MSRNVWMRHCNAYGGRFWTPATSMMKHLFMTIAPFHKNGHLVRQMPTNNYNKDAASMSFLSKLNVT